MFIVLSGQSSNILAVVKRGRFLRRNAEINNICFGVFLTPEIRKRLLHPFHPVCFG